MADTDPRLAAVAAALTPHGLMLRGGFHPQPADGLDGATLLLVGNAGPALWRAFEAYAYVDDAPHPLDRWTRARLDAVSGAFGASALYPFDGPPYHPFQRWALRAEPVHPSPLGMLIHPAYGLWHAYRGALLFRERLALPAAQTAADESPCARCADKPCLRACPVAAFDADRGYDVPACTAHLRGPDGGDCMTGGCLARRACPVGRAYAYDPAQSAFHMTAFERARPTDG